MEWEYYLKFIVRLASISVTASLPPAPSCCFSSILTCFFRPFFLSLSLFIGCLGYLHTMRLLGRNIFFLLLPDIDVGGHVLPLPAPGPAPALRRVPAGAAPAVAVGAGLRRPLRRPGLWLLLLTVTSDNLTRSNIFALIRYFPHLVPVVVVGQVGVLLHVAVVAGAAHLVLRRAGAVLPAAITGG